MQQQQKDKDFLIELQRLKNNYLQSEGLTHRVSHRWWGKVLVLSGLVLFFYVLSFLVENTWQYFLSLAIYAILSASLVLNVIHDTAHDAVFQKTNKNKWLRNITFIFLGNSPHLWSQEHLVDHHPVANIVGEDLAIIETPLLRFHEGQTWKSFHRFQHYYAPILYCLHITDFYFYSEFRKVYALYRQQKHRSILHWFWICKLVHFICLFLLPLYWSPFSIGIIILGFLLIQMIHSWVLIYFLGISHLNDRVPFYKDNSILKKQGWVACQIESAVDYGVGNFILTTLLGGFNIHVLHHLLPSVAHVHLNALMPEFKKLCLVYGYDYKACSYFELLGSHFRLLKKMGKSYPGHLSKADPLKV